MIDTVSVVRKLGWAFLCATIFGWCASAFAQEQFKSPDDAVNALVRRRESRRRERYPLRPW